jgi:hypothetical protein
VKVGFLFRLGSLWVGVHYSANHKRACINLLPCCTIWVVGDGGDVPTKDGVQGIVPVYERGHITSKGKGPSRSTPGKKG